MTRAYRRSLLAMILLSMPIGAFAGDTPGKVEIGFVPFGLSYNSSSSEWDDSSYWMLQGGGGSFFTVDRNLYLQWFATDKLAIEPQFSGVGIFQEDDSLKLLGVSLRANYLFSGADKPSPYIFGGAGIWYVNFGGSDSDNGTNPSAGFGVGFRRPIRTAGSIRFEVGYERIFGTDGDPDTNMVKVALGIALRL